MTAPFVRAVVPEIAQYGANAAIVLAHIRFRCNTDGPGRIYRDGARWWRASRADIAREVGLSAKAVRTALETLGGAVSAKHFPPLSDQSLAYRVPASGDLLTSQKPYGAFAEQPEAARGISDAPQGKAPCPVGQGTVPQRASVLPIENLKTVGERPAPFCDEHPIGTRKGCDGCARAREHLKAWDQRAAEHDVAVSKAHDLERQRKRQLIDSCPLGCDDFGRLEVISKDGNEALKICDHGLPEINANA